MNQETYTRLFKRKPLKDGIIKVIGVGRGGCNAADKIYCDRFQNLTFAICDTDRQTFEAAKIPTHILLGQEGLGTGNKPWLARQKAEKEESLFRDMLSDGTRMSLEPD